jgi:hypothetical protein
MYNRLMNETRFQVQSVESITLGEVVYLALDSDGYLLTDMGSSYFSFLKGVTLIGKGSRNGYRKFFLGWTEHDEDLPRDADTWNRDLVARNHSSLQFVPNLERFTKYITVGAGTRMMQMPVALRVQALKVPPTHDAMVCTRCKEPVLQAAPNMADGSFKCYECRANPFR